MDGDSSSARYGGSPLAGCSCVWMGILVQLGKGVLIHGVLIKLGMGILVQLAWILILLCIPS